MSLPLYNHKGFDLGHTWMNGLVVLPAFFNCSLNLAIRNSWSEPQSALGLCFPWLYRASPSLAAKNIINLISVLMIWWCPCVVFSCVVRRGCLLWPMCSLGKTLPHHCMTSHLYLKSASLMPAYLWSGFLLTMHYAKIVLRTLIFYSMFWNDRIVSLLNRMMVLFPK